MKQLMRILVLTVCLVVPLVHGAAFPYVAVNETSYFFNPESAQELHFGASVSVSGDYIVAGIQTPLSNPADSGFAYVYHKLDGVNWDSSTTRLEADVPKVGDNFGYAVDIDGSTIAIGAPQYDVYTDDDAQGAVFMYDTTDLAGSQVKVVPGIAPNNIAFCGVSLSLYDNVVVVGCKSASYRNMYIYRSSSPGTWNEIGSGGIAPALALAEDTRYGTDVEVVGNTLIVGAPYLDDYVGGTHHSGAAFVYVDTGGDTWAEVVMLTPQVTEFSGNFGDSVGIDSDEKTIIVGYTRVDTDSLYDAGEVYIFHETVLGNGDWQVTSILQAPEPHHQERFGNDVEIHNGLILIGAAESNILGPALAGVVYLFAEDEVDTGYVLKRIVSPSIVETWNYFGDGIGFDGTTIVTGSPKNDEGAYYSGMLYIFDTDYVDQCPGHSCTNGATCEDQYMGYTCNCDVTHTGRLCAECACENGGICAQTEDLTPFCDCPNSVGEICQKNCYNGVPDAAYETCNCTLSGATGKFCTNDVDDCESNPCANGGTCSDYGDDLFPNHNNEFNCSCGSDSPYMGPTCEDTLCISSPCLNDGKCVNGVDVVCDCTDTGYEGEFCQTEVDECASNPCLNDGICTDLLGDFTCECAGTGYEGLTCSDDIDECLSSPCQNDGACQDKGANKFKCTCNEFWEGDTCSDDVDDCLLTVKECLNGGACIDDPVNMGDVICTCIVEDGGFTGKYCDVPIEEACVTFNPCFNGGKCIVDDITNEMSCDCADTGYEGDVCDVQVYVSECVSSPCLNEGQCYDPSDYQDDWYCVCADNYFGVLCELTACASMPCQNGATCSNLLEGGYSCVCLPDFSGVQCQADDGAMVGPFFSSSSIPPDNNQDADTDDNGSGNSDNDGGTLIIVIIIVVVLIIVAIAGFVAWKKTQTSHAKQFVMPT